MAMKLGGEFTHGRAKSYAQNSEINVTPFVDVMLVLLIIFMVAAPLATVAIKVDLPPPVNPTDQKPEPPTFVSLQKTGQIFVGDGNGETEATFATLADVLNTRTNNNKKQRIFVRADQQVVYDDVIKIMNIVQTQGYEKVGLVAEEVVD